MRALLAHGPRDVRVTDIDRPDPGPNDVLARVRAAGICGSDLHWYRGHRSIQSENRVFGHEIAGDVVAVGANVTDLAVGARVGIEPLIGCDACPACETGDYHLCPDLRHIGGYYSGGFAEFTVAPRSKVFPLPDSIGYAEAALLDGFAVAVHAVRVVPISVRDEVVVIGAGTIGLQMLQVARVAGARRVIVTATQPRQAAAARELGAALVIHARQEDPVAAVRAATGGRGAPIVFETVGGGGETLVQALGMAAAGGQVGVLGLFPGPVALELLPPLRAEIAVRFCYSYARWRGVPEYQIALDMMAAGRLDAGPIITHRFGLEDGATAFQAADDKASSGAIKVVVEPGEA